ncbi:MAG: YeeE/YedE thiosulfate transporter family protein, partial [Maioricimonas sp. JB049]
EWHINETRYGGNIIGGLLFGLGFGLLIYCPGTNAAAVGQGNLDALVGIAGLLLGSYLFALTSRYSSGTISQLGNRGKVTLPDMLGVSTNVFVPVAALVLIGVLFLMESLGL